MCIHEGVREVCLFIFWRQTRHRRHKQTSLRPGITTSPLSVLQVHMTDNETMGSGGSVSVSMVSVTSHVSDDEEGQPYWMCTQECLLMTTTVSVTRRQLRCVLSCVKMVVSDLHVSLKTE